MGGDQGGQAALTARAPQSEASTGLGRAPASWAKGLPGTADSAALCGIVLETAGEYVCAGRETSLGGLLQNNSRCDSSNAV